MSLDENLEKEESDMAGLCCKQGNRTGCRLLYRQKNKTLLNEKAQEISTDKLKNYSYLITENLHSVKR